MSQRGHRDSIGKHGAGKPRGRLPTPDHLVPKLVITPAPEPAMPGPEDNPADDAQPTKEEWDAYEKNAMPELTPERSLQLAQAELDRIRDETGQVRHTKPEDCIGCGCMSLTAEEAVAYLKRDRDRLRAELAACRAALRGLEDPKEPGRFCDHADFTPPSLCHRCAAAAQALAPAPPPEAAP